MHFSFGMCLQLGFFMYIPCICALSFMPPLFWNILSYLWMTFISKLKILSMNKNSPSKIIYYDHSLQTFRQSKWWHLCISFGVYPNQFILFKKIDDKVNDNKIQTNNNIFLHLDEKKHQKQFISEDFQIFTYLILFSPIYSLFLFPFFIFSSGKQFLFRILFFLCSIHSWEELNENYSNYKKSLWFATFLCGLGFYISAFLFYPFGVQLWNSNVRFHSKWNLLKNVLLSVFILLACIYCLQWNVHSHFKQKQYEPLLFFSDYLRLDQWWGMFSPNPPLFYGWFVVCFGNCFSFFSFSFFILFLFLFLDSWTITKWSIC